MSAVLLLVLGCEPMGDLGGSGSDPVDDATRDDGGVETLPTSDGEDGSCTGSGDGSDDGSDDGNDGGTGDDTGDGDGALFDDEVLAACPWIADHAYTHETDPFFEPSRVTQIALTMAESDWQSQLADPTAETYVPATVTFCGKTLETAGMRFKMSDKPGATLEEGYPKNPIVLDLNEYGEGDEDLFELKKIDLEYGDDMLLVAERLNWELLASAGLEVSRANYAEVTVNGTYIGVFTNVERVDERFLRYHFGSDDGQLYKHEYCGTFEWLGSDPDTYLDLEDGRCYEAELDESTSDGSDLVSAIEVVDDTSDEAFLSEFPDVWDLDPWLRLAASLQVLGYGDSPNANANNFYTWFPSGGPVQVIPWDMDGGFWWDYQPCENPYDMLHWDLFQISDCYDRLPLFDRVVAGGAWREDYLAEAESFLLAVFTPSAYASRAAELEALLEEPLSRDPNRSGDDDAWRADLQALVEDQATRFEAVQSQLQEAE